MERLTEINERGEGIDCYPKSGWPLGFVIGQEHPLYNIARKLAEYEDLEEQGKLLKLPCAVGDEVYLLLEKMTGGFDILKSRFLKYTMTDKCVSFSVWCDCKEIGNALEFSENDFGKTVFLTEEAAEAALKEL